MSDPKFNCGETVIYTDPNSGETILLRIEGHVKLPRNGEHVFQLYHVSGGMGAPRYVAADAEHLLRRVE